MFRKQYNSSFWFHPHHIIDELNKIFQIMLRINPRKKETCVDLTVSVFIFLYNNYFFFWFFQEEDIEFCSSTFRFSRSREKDREAR